MVSMPPLLTIRPKMVAQVRIFLTIKSLKEKSVSSSTNRLARLDDG